MIDELNLSPTGWVVFFVIVIGLLVAIVRRRSYLTLDCERLEPKEDNHRDEVVGARYGAVMQIERH
ncbi:MAG: hypothetical protein PUG13_03935 [Streptococcus hyointestinalis]|nr:hypothetical protein [Streptococcus hyointestinalis]MDD6384547.1 hypothetical protein [Streptococcus hyointestinalis]